MEYTFAGLSLLGIGLSSYKLKNFVQDGKKLEKPVRNVRKLDEPVKSNIVKKLDDNYMEPDSIKNLGYITYDNTPKHFIDSNKNLVNKYNDLIHRRNEIRQISKQLVFFGSDYAKRCECWNFGVSKCYPCSKQTKTVYKDNIPFTICPYITTNSKLKFSLGELNGEIVHIME